MKLRASRISASIARAISQEYWPRTASGSFWRAILAFFALFRLMLVRYREDDFLETRSEVWHLDEDEYVDSFKKSTEAGSQRGKENDSDLVPMGDLGYSGSTFFATANAKFLIKALPRCFEHRFFTHDLFDAYVEHMKSHPTSLLVRITDMVYTPHATLGGILGTAPTHHIIMENLLYGKELEDDETMRKGWETYDLKPSDYFFPERDVADGRLAPDSVKDRLLDEFPGTIRMSAERKTQLVEMLSADTQVLADHGAVDYSLFLVRYPGPATSLNRPPVATIKSLAGPWRSGVDDADGKWTYRLVVLDFFWAKSNFQAKAMTGVINAFNVFAKKGPMSITAEPKEYRERFMKMVDELVVE